MPPPARERELKLAVTESFMLPDLTDDGLGVLEVRELPELDLRSTYHDTADLRLARSGVTLRYRTGDDSGPTWTLKLRVEGRDGTERDEHSFPGSPGEVPADALRLVAAIARHEPLVPVASLHTRRQRWLLLADGEAPLAELADDEVSVLDGDRVLSRFRELELESRGPELKQLRPVAARLRRAGAVLAEPVPKAIRAMGPRADAQPDVTPLTARPGDPAADAVKAALASGTLRLIENDPATRLGDEEGLHQMRVSTRRLRSDLRTFAALLDQAWADGLSEELRWLGGLLGSVRDLDVQIAGLETMAADLAPALAPLFSRLRDRRDAARAELLAAIESERYVDLLDRLVQAQRDPLLSPLAEMPATEVLPRLLEDPWRKLERRANALTPDDPDVSYHAVRIRAKRARYAAEAIAPAVNGSKRVETLAGRAADLQELLGRMQDAVLAEQELLRVMGQVPRDAKFGFAAGRLIERERGAIAEARAAFPDTWKRTRRLAAKVVEKH
jgi:inorganic triphosphatase YgiF